MKKNGNRTQYSVLNDIFYVFIVLLISGGLLLNLLPLFLQVSSFEMKLEIVDEMEYLIYFWELERELCFTRVVGTR
jgi:hypothetical protein